MKATYVTLFVLCAMMPFAVADDAVVHEACVAADAALDYETCSSTASGGAQVSVFPTQVVVECTTSKQGGEECTYAPSYHIALDGTPAGDWVLRATHQLRSLGSGEVLASSVRELSCRASGVGAACDASAEAPSITTNRSSAFGWESAWDLALVDALGAEHVTASGSSACTIGQYYPC